MGGLFTSFISLFKTKKELRFLMVGLDRAGKSTIVATMQIGKPVPAPVKPTIGFNLEEITFQSLKLKVWDISGQERYRALWKHYYEGSNGIVFVIDCTDKERIGEVRDEFHRVLIEQDLSYVRILVFANKQDLPDAMNGKEIKAALGLGPEYESKVKIQESSAKNNTGLIEGFTWLVNEIETKLSQ